MTIQGNGSNRVFEILGLLPAAGPVTSPGTVPPPTLRPNPLAVSFQNLTIKGGKAEDAGQLGGEAAVGGGILIDGGQVTLSHVNVSGNMVQGKNATGVAVAGKDAAPEGLPMAAAFISPPVN